MMLTAFTITELSVALVSVIAACGICMRQSRCDQIQMPCCSVHRVVEGDAPDEAEVELTPMPKAPAKEGKISAAKQNDPPARAS